MHKDQEDKKVPLHNQIQNSKKTSSVELKYEIDGAVEKTKLSLHEDSNDEEFLKMILEFQNYIEAYKNWNNDNTVRIAIISEDASLEELETCGIR